jgi:hypothetical protein
MFKFSQDQFLTLRVKPSTVARPFRLQYGPRPPQLLAKEERRVFIQLNSGKSFCHNILLASDGIQSFGGQIMSGFICFYETEIKLKTGLRLPEKSLTH